MRTGPIRLAMTKENVIASLEGRKTETRRVLTVHWHKGKRCAPYEPWYVEEDGKLLYQDEFGDYHDMVTRCPYGVPGDPLVLTETWRPRDVRNIRRAQKALIEYRADGKTLWLPIPDLDARGKIERALKHGKWLPPMFMQAWASRAPAVNTDVRVQRVQKISAEDAVDEGTRCHLCGGPMDASVINDCSCIDSEDSVLASFRVLWDSIYKKQGHGWDKNDWVWAVTFKLAKGT